MFYRYYQDLEKEFRKNRVLIIYGPRRTGKTTLLEGYLSGSGKRYVLEHGENIRFAELATSGDVEKIKGFFSEYQIIAIDEAQIIPDIGNALKLLVDHLPDTDTVIIATGSSSFDLSQRTGEPLTGRKRTLILFPVSQDELKHDFTRYDLDRRLEEFLVFGAYPEVLSADSKREKIEILQELTDSYLLKDIFTLERIKSSHTFLKLLQLLTFQIGNEVSSHELASAVGVDAKTVNRYLDLLEKCFVIKQLGPYSGNLRNAILKKKKYYFLDQGIRNAIIGSFQSIEDRNDTGQLFEQFLIMERLKRNSYSGYYGNSYFWRTYSGQEIDYIEEIDDMLHAYKFIWSGKNHPKVPRKWSAAYPASSFSVVNRDNYLDFILAIDSPAFT